MKRTADYESRVALFNALDIPDKAKACRCVFAAMDGAGIVHRRNATTAAARHIYVEQREPWLEDYEDEWNRTCAGVGWMCFYSMDMRDVTCLLCLPKALRDG
jgi:hypothetical protein